MSAPSFHILVAMVLHPSYFYGGYSILFL